MIADNLNAMQFDAERAFPALADLPKLTRHRLIRRIRYKAINERRSGETDPTKIRDACLQHVQKSAEFGSIIAVISIAVLTALVEWAVKRILDRWFAGGGDDS